MTVQFRNGNKVTANKATLNELSIALRYASEKLREKDRLAMSQHYKEMADVIYDELDKENYFD